MLRPLIKLRLFLVPWLGVAWAASPLAAQRVPDAMPRYSVGALDIAALGVGLVVTALPDVLGKKLPYATCMPCDPSGLPGIDRGVIGDVNHNAALASDLAWIGTTLGGGALLFNARHGQSTEAKWEDVAIYSQSIVLTSAVTQWSKVLFQRPRPPRYGANAADYPGVDYGRSFPSGHTSSTFAAAASYWSILHRRGEAGRHKSQILLMFGAATLTGTLRVVAHKHFPTDVLAGAVLGTAIGYATPQLHGVQ